MTSPQEPIADAAELDRLAANLRDAAAQLSNRNWVEGSRGGFHMPSATHYCSLFAWDSGWQIIGLGAVQPERAIQELQTVFALQHESGAVPHEVRFPELSHREGLTRRGLLWLLRSQFDEWGRSRFIDPPSFLVAAEVLWERTRDPRILELLPAMQACLDYLTGPRDMFGDGLVSIIHPWESGCDSAPIFEAPLGVDRIRFGRGALREWCGLRLLWQLDGHRWDLASFAGAGGFACEDLGTNGLCAAGALSMAVLYQAAGQSVPAANCRATAERMCEAMERVLWDDARGFFFPRYDPRDPKLSFRTCNSGLAPLMTGLVSPEKAMRVIDGHLLSPRHFATHWLVPYNSQSELEAERMGFRNQRLWRGPCIWISMNWIAARAAARAGRADVARYITLRTAQLIDRTGFREFYDPGTGEGGGATGFTWPALVLDMIETYGLEPCEVPRPG